MSPIGTHSPFGALHKSGSYRGIICRAFTIARPVSFDPHLKSGSSLAHHSGSPAVDRCGLMQGNNICDSEATSSGAGQSLPSSPRLGTSALPREADQTIHVSCG